MRYFRLDLLTLLVSLFTFSACQNSEIIGIDTGDAEKISATQTDTSTVTSTTVRDDSFVSINLKQHALGFIKSNVFGSTEANLALSFSYPRDSTDFTFGEPPTVIDSAVLVLKYGSEFLGDTTKNYTFNVYQLDDTVNSKTGPYRSDKIWNYDSLNLLGSRTASNIAIRKNISVKIVRPGKEDTTQSIPGQLRIRLNDDFIQQEIIGPISTGLKENRFVERFRGLYLKVDKGKSTGEGGIVFLDSIINYSGIELYYQRSVGTKKIRSVIFFPVLNSVSAVKHNYTGSGVGNSLNIPKANVTYAQALGGVRTKINFPYLNQLKKLGNISINKAQLVLFVDPAIQNSLGNAQRLILYTTDIAGQRQEIPDNDWGQISGIQRTATQFGGVFDTTKKTYTFNVTGFIQSVITGRANLYDSYIAPIKIDMAPKPRRIRGAGLTELETIDIDAYPSGTTASHAVLGGGTQSSSPVRIKLVITYTKLSQ